MQCPEFTLHELRHSTMQWLSALSPNCFLNTVVSSIFVISCKRWGYDQGYDGQTQRALKGADKGVFKRPFLGWETRKVTLPLSSLFRPRVRSALVIPSACRSAASLAPSESLKGTLKWPTAAAGREGRMINNRVG